MNHDTAAALGLCDDDWVVVTSRHGRIRAQLRLMAGVEPGTVWTWNAIAKRAGAWSLAPDAPEMTRGFLLNHLIDDLLPADTEGYRFSNSDPVTGQAAWYDLNVRVEQASAPARQGSEPTFAPLPRVPGLPEAPLALRYGADLRRARS